MPYSINPRPASVTVFTEPVCARIRELAGTKTARQIADELHLSKGSLHIWAQSHGVSLALNKDPAITETTAAAIREMAGWISGRVIAERLDINYGTLRKWASSNGVRLLSFIMADEDGEPIDCLDNYNSDPLLERLRAEHGERRPASLGAAWFDWAGYQALRAALAPRLSVVAGFEGCPVVIAVLMRSPQLVGCAAMHP